MRYLSLSKKYFFNWKLKEFQDLQSYSFMEHFSPIFGCNFATLLVVVPFCSRDFP